MHTIVIVHMLRSTLCVSLCTGSARCARGTAWQGMQSIVPAMHGGGGGAASCQTEGGLASSALRKRRGKGDGGPGRERNRPPDRKFRNFLRGSGKNHTTQFEENCR